MYNNPYMYTRFMPNMYMGMGPIGNATSSIPTGINATRGFSTIGPNIGINTIRGTSSGIFPKLGKTFSALKGFNWGNLINNASKTVGVINQTIPLVKQAGPMFRNMKSVLKIASVFKDETDPISKNTSNNKNTIPQKKEKTIIDNNQTEQLSTHIAKDDIDNSPIFFVN